MAKSFSRQAARLSAGLLMLATLLLTPHLAVARFIDNGNGTITDSVTGYMWQKKAPDSQFTFDGARSYASRLTLAGYRDWRIPDRDALLSIVDSSRYPAIAEAGFKNTRAADYWTATTAAPISLPEYAYVVCFENGLDFQRSKTEYFYVRAVRDARRGDFCDDDDDRWGYVSCFVGTLSAKPPDYQDPPGAAIPHGPASRCLYKCLSQEIVHAFISGRSAP